MTKKTIPRASPIRFVASLLLLAFIASGLLIIRISASDSSRFSFLFWNLFLASIPLAIAWWLAMRVRDYGWLRPKQIILTVLWIAFLPNSFYIITDLIHLRQNYEADPLYDITLLTGFILSGLSLGYASVYLVHQEFLKRVRERTAYGVLAILFLAVSFAISLGRYTRWNTWDIILQPAGLLFDVSDRFINPEVHAGTYQITVSMALLLFAGYVVIYEAARLIKR